MINIIFLKEISNILNVEYNIYNFTIVKLMLINYYMNYVLNV